MRRNALIAIVAIVLVGIYVWVQIDSQAKIEKIRTDLVTLDSVKSKYIKADVECARLIEKVLVSIMKSQSKAISEKRKLEIQTCYHDYRDRICSFDDLLVKEEATAKLIETAEWVVITEQGLQQSIHQGGKLDNISDLKDKIGQMDWAIINSMEALTQWENARDEYNKHEGYIVSHRLDRKFPKNI